MSQQQYAQRIKLGLIGPLGSGKTHFLHRYLFGSHKHRQINPTIAVQFYERVINVRETSVALRIWDSSGQQKYKPMVPYHLKQCQIILLIYDAGRQESIHELQSLLRWLQRQNFDLKTKKLRVIGNKLDMASSESMTRKVPKRQLKALLGKHGLQVDEIHEVSAISSDPEEQGYIQEIVEGVIEQVLEEREGDEILTMRRKLGSQGITVTQEGEEVRKDKYCGNYCGGDCLIF